MSRLDEFDHDVITDVENLRKICAEIKALDKEPVNNRVFALDLGGPLKRPLQRISSATIFFRRKDEEQRTKPLVYIVNIAHLHKNDNTVQERRARVQPLIDLIEDIQIVTVMHGSTSDCRALNAFYNIRKVQNLYDTAVAACAMGFGFKLSIQSLIFGLWEGKKVLQKARLNYPKMKWDDYMGGEKPLTPTHIRYMAEDVLWLLDIRDKMEEKHLKNTTAPSPKYLRYQTRRAHRKFQEFMTSMEFNKLQKMDPLFLTKTETDHNGNCPPQHGCWTGDLDFELSKFYDMYDYPIQVSDAPPNPNDHEKWEEALRNGEDERAVSDIIKKVKNKRSGNESEAGGSQHHPVENDEDQALMVPQNPVSRKRKTCQEESSRPSKFSRRI